MRRDDVQGRSVFVVGLGDVLLCPSHDGYSVKDGEVYTHRKRFGKGRWNGGGVKIDYSYYRKMNQFVSHGGYKYVSVSTSRGQRSIPAHVMITDAHFGPRPPGLETRHLDGDPQNNTLSNLCYGTRKENAEDTKRHRRHRPRRALSDDDVRSVRQLRQQGMTCLAIAKHHGVSKYCVWCVVAGKTYTSV